MAKEGKYYTNIRARILVPVIIALIFIAAIGVYSAYVFYIKLQVSQLEEKKQRMDLSFNARIETDSQRISGLINIIKKNKKIENALKARNRDELFIAAKELYNTYNQNFEITHFYFHDIDGVNFLRVHHPDRYGDLIQRATLRQAMITQKLAYGLELGVFGQFVLRVVEPFYIDNVLAGYIELGREINSITQSLKSSVGIEKIILIDKTLINRDDWSHVFGRQAAWDDYKKWVMASPTVLVSHDALRKAIAQMKTSSTPVIIEEQMKKFITTKVPLTDMSGKEVGFSVLLLDSTSGNIQLINVINNIVIIGVIIIFLIASFYYIYVGRIQNQLDITYQDLSRKISEHQLAEEELRKNRDALKTSNQELESYSYSIAHDLRTPLRAITGFSQIIEEEEGSRLSEDGRNSLARIILAGKRMSRLIEDILKLSLITRMDLNYQEVDLSIMANEIREHLETMYSNRKIEWVIQSDVLVNGDARLIERVLENLLGNAVKYTAAVDHARIEFGQTRHTGDVIYFVRDNGIGFDMQYSSKLFGTFQRLHGEEYDGTGVGLATVQRIIHRHGGKVWAEAEVDRGATFYFTLGK